MAADNMSTKDVSKGAAKKAREEMKKIQFEKRLELEQRRDALKRRGRRLMRTGFGVLAFGVCSIAYTYYTKPGLIQDEKERLDNMMCWPTSGPKS